MSYKKVRKFWDKCPFWAIIIILIALIITLVFNCKYPNAITDVESGSAVEEIHAFFYFLSGVGTILLVYVAYMQLGPINKTAKAEFLLRIDERWNSKEITRTRKKLWTEYRIGKKGYKRICEKTKHLKGIQKAGQHIVDIHKDPAQIDLLFEYLNFMELLGTINYIREKGLIENDFVGNLFGGKLKTYVEFYELYFIGEFGCKNDDNPANENCIHCEKIFSKGDYCEKKEHPQALKLLVFLREQENSTK